tara:strand:- start:1457 stop:2254 length:798 start_codon:yes stop_codon:yes gene_type:complete
MKLNLKECLVNYVVYRKKDYNDTYSIISKICGVPSLVSGYVHEQISEYGEFNDEAILIPKGYRKIKSPSEEWIKEHVCRKIPTFPKNIKNTPEYRDWFENSRPYWLKIDDVLKLKHNETISLIMLDRNVLDVVLNSNKMNKVYTATHFFRNQKALYTHDVELYGKLRLIGHKESKIEWKFDKGEGFHIQYAKDNWYPLINDYLPKYGDTGPLLNIQTHWKEFDVNTPIGWRGPLIKWSNIEKIGKIWYDETKDEYIPPRRYLLTH